MPSPPPMSRCWNVRVAWPAVRGTGARPSPGPRRTGPRRHDRRAEVHVQSRDLEAGQVRRQLVGAPRASRSTPNLFSFLPVLVYLWVFGSTSGFTRMSTRPVRPGAARSAEMRSSSGSDSTVKQRMSSLQGVVDFRRRSCPRPRTRSGRRACPPAGRGRVRRRRPRPPPRLRRASTSITAALELDFTAKQISGSTSASASASARYWRQQVRAAVDVERRAVPLRQRRRPARPRRGATPSDMDRNRVPCAGHRFSAAVPAARRTRRRRAFSLMKPSASFWL